MNSVDCANQTVQEQTDIMFAAATEFKIVALRESSPPYKMWLCETPEQLVEYWRKNVATSPWFQEDRECFVAIFLNARKRVIGHHLVSIGLLDQMIVHPREAFRAAIIAAAHSVIFGHNHPSGDETPSPTDIAATKDFVQAGEVLGISVIDHIVLGHSHFASLRQLGAMR